MVDRGWKAGVATTLITPTEPMWLAGWAVRRSPAQGTINDLFAKALAVEDGEGNRLILVTVDLIAVSRDIAASVADGVRRRWDLPRERLLLCASHTHCGPEVRPNKVPFFHIPPEYAAKIDPYVEWLTARLVEVVGAAIGDLRPAQLTMRQSTTSFARNRRGTDAVDHDVPVLEVTTGDRRRAVVFGYACHNTTMPPEDDRYCGDYAGFAAADLEADGVTALFVAGAGADQDPEPRGSLEATRRHGATLAAAVRASLAQPGRDIAGELRVAFDEIPLAFQPPPPPARLEEDLASEHLPTRTKARYLRDRLDRGEPLPATYPCPLQVVRFGDGLLLLGLGGEPVVDYANFLKRRYARNGRMVWVAGYANDMFGYLPTADILRDGGYEGTRSLLWSALPAPFADDAEQRILDGLNRLVTRIEA